VIPSRLRVDRLFYDLLIRELIPLGLAEVGRMLGSPTSPEKGVAVALSMYLWGALPERWRETGRVHPHPYRIDPEAWNEVAANLGLPIAT
jgi:hypothetical protein